MQSTENQTIFDHIGPPFKSEKSGFALVISLSLMVLLAALALGLLSLSAISLREADSQNSRRQAMSNARLALQLALGDLQRLAGPDKRITAPSEILGDKVIRRHVAGVWESRNVDPFGSIESLENAGKSRFRGWLTSTGQPGTSADSSLVLSAASDRVVLLGNRGAGDPESETSAERVVVRHNGRSSTSGGFAYTVFDEGVKARIDLGSFDPPDDLVNRGFALGGGQRPAIDRISGTGDAADSAFNLDDDEGRSRIAKTVTRDNADLAYQAEAGTFRKHFHDFTTSSTGLMTDVAMGGMKRDLSLAAESGGTPKDLAGRKIYREAFGTNVPSDPSWDRIFSTLNLYRGSDEGGAYLFADHGVPVIRATAPRTWNAGNGVISGPAVPSAQSPLSPVLMPSVAKVQMVFSLVARDIYRYPKGQDVPADAGYLHNPWAGFFQYPMNEGAKIDSKYDYLLHMLYTPVVTLHNPYNVAIEFKELRVEFVDLPFSLQVFRNGEAQTKGLVPFNGMFGGGGSFGQSKRFGLNISGKNAKGEPDGSPVRMAPGEVKVFSPYIPPERTWADEISQPLWFADWANNNSLDGRIWTNLAVDTSKIKAVSGWRGDGIGYDLDSFAPAKYNVSNVEKEGGHKYQRDQCIGLRKDDKVHVEFAPLPDPDRHTTRFTVETTLVGANPNANARTSVIEFEYQTMNGLRDKLWKNNTTMRYPPVGDISTMEMFDHSSVPVGSTANTKPFALFSAFAKTTHGGFNGSKEDGSYASKPWSFHNHTALTASQNIIREHPAQHSHELSLIRLPGSTDEIIDIQPGTDRGHFITGHRVLTGRRLGSIFDIPLGPATNLMALNAATPAASFYLPRFTSPVGNSFAHPLLPVDKVSKKGPAGYPCVDHSFLLNAALFDHYCFSGLQGRQGPFGDERDARTIAEDFLARNQSLPDRRFEPYLADSQSQGEVVDGLLEADGWKHAGACLMFKGAFNVNSVSVEAWTAELASMSGSGAAILRVNAGGSGCSIDDIEPAGDPKGARFSRFRLPNARPDESDPDAYWLAPRDLTAEELRKLAKEIVTQVKVRGPFLSMADFVNRDPAGSGGASSCGALQTAIDHAGVNENANLGGFEIQSGDVSSQELANVDAATGPSAQGAPGFLMQADVLGVLGNAATVRSDTFVIRGYGDARDAGGGILARAWCEAVVQRVPSYVDSADPADTPPDLLQSEVNRNFGRRFRIVSFRWLASDEV